MNAYAAPMLVFLILLLTWFAYKVGIRDGKLLRDEEKCEHEDER